MRAKSQLKMPPNQSAAANPAIALRLQSTRLVGRVAELGSLGHYAHMKTNRAIAVTIIAFFLLFGSQPNTSAQVFFYDNFEQFTNGTDLTATSYVPVSGPSSALAETSIQNGTPTTTVTNFFGSKWLLSDNSVPPLNKNQYKGYLSSVQTNRALEVTWRMWISATNSGPGFIFLSVPVNDPTPGVTYNPPLAFADNGTIFALTNGTTPPTPIGSWGALAGTVMTNTLFLDYVNRVFSYSLNGQTLVTLPLGPYFTNIVGAIYFNGFERSTGSLGNRFAIDDVKVALRPVMLGIQWSNSMPRLTVSGDRSNRFVVEYVSALASSNNWQSLTTNTLTSSPVVLTDSSAAGSSNRFYRARLLP